MASATSCGSFRSRRWRSSRSATSTARCSTRPPNLLPRASETTSGRDCSRIIARCSGDGNLDIVLIGTPDHWHALPMIAAVEAGADVWVQKPISVDIAEGQAMVAAARRTGKVVQVGTQRRSTPHIIDAKERVVLQGVAREDRPCRDYCYYHMRARDNPADTPRRLIWIMKCGQARRPCALQSVVHPVVARIHGVR